jgi:general secretion pathway protein E
VTKTFTPGGCPRCLRTGFSGRRALFELLRVGDELRDVIAKSPTNAAIHEVLAKQQFESLARTGYQLVADGMCSFSEIQRTVGREHVM